MERRARSRSFPAPVGGDASNSIGARESLYIQAELDFTRVPETAKPKVEGEGLTRASSDGGAALSESPNIQVGYLVWVG